MPLNKYHQGWHYLALLAIAKRKRLAKGWKKP
jgi:hypothetical protein